MPVLKKHKTFVLIQANIIKVSEKEERHQRGTCLEKEGCQLVREGFQEDNGKWKGPKIHYLYVNTANEQK